MRRLSGVPGSRAGPRRGKRSIGAAARGARAGRWGGSSRKRRTPLSNERSFSGIHEVDGLSG